jgi:hypothetical protein
MEFKDKWRGMQVPDKFRYAFFRWDMSGQTEEELDAKTVIAVLETTSVDLRDAEWKSSMDAVLNAPLACELRKPEVTDQLNHHGFPHWGYLDERLQGKANRLELDEKDFRDYDRSNPMMRPEDEWVYRISRQAIGEILYHQSQCTPRGRFSWWATHRHESFWPTVVVLILYVRLWTWFWNSVCPLWPDGLTQHQVEVQNIVNPYYYSSSAEHWVGWFWGGAIVGLFVVPFLLALWGMVAPILGMFGFRTTYRVEKKFGDS